MSPTIVGEHYDVRCDACGFRFACDLEQANLRQRLICPNCGSGVDRQSWHQLPAESVTIDLSNHLVRRWDVVAIEMPSETTPDRDSIAGIKRVLGLPGESITLRDGNVIANGSIARKNLNQQKQVRLPVIDSAFRSQHFTRNWQFGRESQWSLDETFTFNPEYPAGNLDWFAFQNQKNYSRGAQFGKVESFASPIEDFYAFNQSLSRELHEMDEVFVELEIVPSPGGTFAWRFNRRGTIHEFQLVSRKLIVRTHQPDSTVQESSFGLPFDPFLKPGFQLEFSTFDQQLAVWLDGKSVFSQPISDSTTPIASELLRFGAGSAPLAINRIRIWRDLYYYSDSAATLSFPVTVQPNAIFVVGDNVPCSQDSRHWQTPSLPHSSVIGHVKHP